MLNDLESRFLLVFLSIRTILQETTISRRRERLRAIEKGLDLGDAYRATLGRIKAQGREKAKLGMAVLMWISNSRRPLRVDEISHATAIRIGSNELDNDDIPAISTMLSCCQGLATIGEGTSTVRLIHFTLQEYLCTHPDLFERVHSTMAETCLTYLNFRHIKDLSMSVPPNLQSTLFLEYSSLYWGVHMRMEVSDRANAFALHLLQQFHSHISATFLWKSISEKFISREYPWVRTPDRKGFSALHCVSYFGIAEVADTLIKMNRWSVNEADGSGVTPLIWAARHGHEEVVKLLLQIKHIQLGRRDTNSGRTALSWTAGNGHEGVVRLFLGPRFVNLGSVGGWWREAARVVGVLFGWRYVNPDSTCNNGQTPLIWAAKNGHEGIVKLLLERNVHPDTPDAEYTRTPLSLAAENGYEGIAKLLLERKEVNPNSLSKYSRTPLSWAAENGREGVVKLLLGRGDVNSDTPDSYYFKTPLSWAAENGREGVVKLLLERGDVNPNGSSESDRTPLLWAVWNGHEGVAKLLLGRGDVNPDTPDSYYSKTPLSWAAGDGHVGIVKLLLGRGDVNPDSLSKYGRTPLSWAAGNGRERIVKLLSGREDVNPDSPSESGRTPLLWAAGNGHEETVKLFLARKDVHPDTPDTVYGQTPLSWAALNGHEGIVRLLLARKDVHPDTPDTDYGQTPLSWAAGNGHEGIVELLLERENVNPNSSSKSGKTPLTLAAEKRHYSVVELLQAYIPDVSSN